MLPNIQFGYLETRLCNVKLLRSKKRKKKKPQRSLKFETLINLLHESWITFRIVCCLHTRDMTAIDIKHPLFGLQSTSPVTEMDTTPTSDVSMKPPSDIMNDPLIEPMSSQTGNKPASEPSDDFFDLTNNVSVVAAAATKSDDFVDILGSETGAQRGEVVKADVTVEATIDRSEVTAGVIDPLSQQEAKQTSTAPVIDLSGDSQPVTSKIADPLVDLFSDAPPAAEAKKPSSANVDLFDDEEGSDIFAEPLQTKPAKQPQKSLFGEPDEDVFGEPLGAISKKPVPKELKEKSVTTKVTAGGPLQDSKPADIFSQAAASTPSVTSTVNPKTNGVHSEEDGDIFAGGSTLFYSIFYSHSIYVTKVLSLELVFILKS